MEKKKIKDKYSFNEFYLDFICLLPLIFLLALIFGNIILNGF